MELNNKRIVVTGAMGSLGRAVCLQAIASGAQVIGIDRVADTSAKLEFPVIALDLSDAEATAKGFQMIADQYGPIDGLVNVAGGFRWETVTQGSIDTWDAMYGINVRTAVNACQAVLPVLRDGGRIVNIGAAGATKGTAGFAAYAASKSAVARLTEALSDELKARDITVNAVLPSIIDTPPNRHDMPDADYTKWVTPGALADVISFLLSDRAAAITGALIPVTGRV